jgi:hypothetical protein
VSRLSPVAHNVESSDNLADSEESKNFSSRHTIESQLLLIGAAQTGQEGLRGRDVKIPKVGRVAENVNDGLEVGLESSQVTGLGVSELCFHETDRLLLTEESSSGL